MKKVKRFRTMAGLAIAALASFLILSELSYWLKRSGRGVPSEERGERILGTVRTGTQ